MVDPTQAGDVVYRDLAAGSRGGPGAPFGLHWDTIRGFDQPPRRNNSSDRQGDGAARGTSWLGQRSIEAVNATIYGDSALASWRAAMGNRDEADWRFLGLGFGTDEISTVRAAPDKFTFDLSGVEYRTNVYTVSLSWVCSDPVIYGEDTEYEIDMATDDSVEITNAGSFAARGGGAYDIDFVAGGSGCVNPWIRHADHTGETVLFLYSFPASSHLTVATEGPAQVRMPRIGGVVSKSKLRGPSGSPAPGWPVLRPGVNTLEVGCDSGGGVWTITARNTSV